MQCIFFLQIVTLERRFANPHGGRESDPAEEIGRGNADTEHRRALNEA
jgi:hypothetical protein